ncbi:MAG: amidotransferase 1, exosortase A system-associated, partial [Thermoanaerobaculia bacterium]|nr:amidotransferase 1, exosortase A system-associated [Thermoanaerobaculia bacterium]
VAPGVGLAHRRLSIIDLSSGQQPLFNEDGSVVVVYNGEIYNFAALREELLELGHDFVTHSDTEVIVHAWEQWGEECVQRFRGMFAFAVWDRNRETLFLARDRLGIKPLYYALLDDGWLVFASELKALRAHPGLARGIDPRAVEEYLAFGYVPEPRSIYAGCYKLPPGHTLRWPRGAPQSPAPREYWDVPFGREEVAGDEERLLESLVERIRESVAIRLIAEVPLGAFLSGGVDSSSVVAMMSQVSGPAVNTCSIGFGEAEFDETDYAQAVADRYHTRHRVETVDPSDYSLLDRLTSLYDEPFADSSAMPTYRVCELARREVTVALSGDGGDELLAGYRRYGWQLDEEAMRARLPGWVRRTARLAGRYYPHLPAAPRPLRARARLRTLGSDPVGGYLNLVSVLDDDLRQRLYRPEFRRELQGYTAAQVMHRHLQGLETDDPLTRWQYLDIKTYLPGDILTKVDRASMAHSLEVRVPLLDHGLVEWLAGIPSSWKRREGTGKYLLKKAMEPFLPAEILYRQKRGFAVPLAEWFRGPLRERLQAAVTSEVMHDAGFFQRRSLEALLDEHLRGHADRSASLWSLLMLESFLRAEAG